MPPEKKTVIKEAKNINIGEALDIRSALEGTYELKSKRQVLAPVNKMNVPVGKTSWNVAVDVKRARNVDETYEEQTKKLQNKYFEFDSKGKIKRNKETNEVIYKPKMTKEGMEKDIKTLLATPCGQKFLTLSASTLERTPGITPEHLILLMPIIEGDFTQE